MQLKCTREAKGELYCGVLVFACNVISKVVVRPAFNNVHERKMVRSSTGECSLLFVFLLAKVHYCSYFYWRRFIIVRISTGEGSLLCVVLLAMVHYCLYFYWRRFIIVRSSTGEGSLLFVVLQAKVHYCS